NLQDRAIQYNILKREWETNKQLYSGLLERMKEVGVAAGMELNNISIIDRAVIPVAPYKPKLRSNVSVAGLLGLMGGLGLAFLLAYLDNTLRTPEELEKVLGLSSLGMVPKADPKELSEVTSLDLVSHQERDSELSEAFRSIRTSLMFSSPQGPPKTLLVTSATPSEGKSMNAANLAVVLAQNNAAVLLVDSDLRKPRIHRIFGKPLSPGLTEHLVGKRQNTIHDTEIPNLSVISAGTLPPNPAELLGSTSMDTFLNVMSDMFDYVILDSAPILGLADSVITSTKVKGTLLTVNASTTSKHAVREAVKRLRNVQAPLLGAVLNMVDMSSNEYGYYCNYYYSYKTDKKDLEKLAVGGRA
ncbi:MAG: polysaccharide biosynthesis tyrosine autokinase, partial [Gammaproteobacteria bacterium]